MNFRKIIISLAAALTFTAAFAQVESAGGVRKRSERDKTADRERSESLRTYARLL